MKTNSVWVEPVRQQIEPIGPGLGEVAIFEIQKLNNIMKLISDIQLKLLGQAAILPNPLLYAVFCEAAEHLFKFKNCGKNDKSV